MTTISYHPVVLHTIDIRDGTWQHVHATLDRFEKLNGVRPQLVTREDTGIEVNSYWYVAWLWDVVPSDAEYVLCVDSKVLPILPLPDLPALKFAAAMDRHDRVNQGKAASDVVKQTGKYFQMRVFVAHRDTRPVFEELKKLSRLPRHNEANGRATELGFDGRGIFTPMNELIQARFPVHELPREWNYNITYEKQGYTDHPYMINFNSNEFGTWAYLRYIRQLIERIEALGGSLRASSA